MLSRYRWLLGFSLCLTVLCGIAAYIGVVPTRVGGHDTFFLLENGWRAVHGQRTHVDFFSPWGPLTFLVVGLGLELSRGSADGIGYGSALFGLLIGTWSFVLLRDRFGELARLLMSLYLAALVVAPYPLGVGLFSTSHAMVYNRYGYALLGLILLECCGAGTERVRREREIFGGLTTGAALSLVLFLKVSCFFVAVFLVAGCFVLQKPTLRRLGAMAVGWLTITAAMCGYLGFDVSAVLADWRMAAGARLETLYADDVVQKKLTGSLPYAVIAAWLGIRGSLSERQGGGGWQLPRLLLLGALVFVADLLLLFSNQQPTQFPLTTMYCLVVAVRLAASTGAGEATSTWAASSTEKPSWKHFSRDGVSLVAAAFFLLHFAVEISAVGYGAIDKLRPSNPDSIARFDQPHLAALLLYDNEYDLESNGATYVRYINDGADILRRNSSDAESVLTIDMMNPFPYVMQRVPAVGGIAAAAYRYTLSDDYHPSDDKYFGTADLVMVPKRPSSPAAYYDGFYRIYEQGLHRRFRLVEQSTLWYLYRRR